MSARTRCGRSRSTISPAASCSRRASDGALPRGYHPGLLQIHDRKPFAASIEDIDALAAEVRDANFRIVTAEDGIHVFNSKGHAVAKDAFELFRRARRRDATARTPSISAPS